MKLFKQWSDNQRQENENLRKLITRVKNKKKPLLSYLWSLALNSISWRDLLSRLISAEETFMMRSLLNSLEKYKDSMEC